MTIMLKSAACAPTTNRVLLRPHLDGCVLHGHRAFMSRNIIIQPFFLSHFPALLPFTQPHVGVIFVELSGVKISLIPPAVKNMTCNVGTVVWQALQVLENTVPKAFLSLETRLRRAEDTLAGMKEMIAATLASAEKAVAASTEAASAASAAAASMSEAIARGNRSSRGVDSGRLGSALRLPSQSQPQPLLLQQQQQVDVRQHRVRQLEPKTLASGKTDVPSLVGAHQHRQPGGRKRKNGGYLQQHQHAPPAATLRQTECDGRHDDGSEVRLGGADLPEVRMDQRHTVYL